MRPEPEQTKKPRKLKTLSEIGVLVPKKGTSPNPSQESQSIGVNFEKAISDDDYCATQRVKTTFSQDVDALMLLISRESAADDDLIALYQGRDAPILGHPRANGNSNVLEFFNALLLSDLIYGVRIEEHELRTGLEMLDELSRLDPKNAAYPYFAAAVSKELGDPESEVTQRLLSAFDRPYFDAHYAMVARHLTDRASVNATAWLYAWSVVSRIPVPDFSPSNSVLNPLIDQGDSRFLQGVLRLGQAMMDAGMRTHSLEFPVGRNYYLRAWRRLHPGEKDPEFPKNWAEPETDALDGFFLSQEPGAACDRRGLDEAFKKFVH